MNRMKVVGLSAALVVCVLVVAQTQAAGVTVGSSGLISALDYSDTYTIGAGSPIVARQSYPAQTFPLPAGVEVAEDTHGNPARSWPTNIWSIATDASFSGGSFGYPGPSGAGTTDGFTQKGGGGDWSIAYGLRNSFLVQVDAVQQPDRVDITVGSNPNSIAGAGNISIFFRQTAHPSFPEIGIYNNTVAGPQETNTGLTSGIAGNKQWHNYALGVNVPNQTIEVFVDEVSRGVIDLTTFAGGKYAGILNNAYVGTGGSGSDRLWSDNFQVGRIKATQPAPEGASISLTTDVLNQGDPAYKTYADGYNNASISTVELVRFIPTSDASPIDVAYNQAGDTIDVSPFVVSGPQRGAGQRLQVNGYGAISGSNPAGATNLYLRGEPNVNNEGFGAHANWIVTFDLDDIREDLLGGTDAVLNLTGDFGMWGAAASPVQAQRVIYLDGVRIDSMALATATVNQSFDLNIPTGRWLTFGIFNGSDTVWDDALFQNVRLTVVPEPLTAGLLCLAGGALGGYVRRRRRS